MAKTKQTITDDQKKLLVSYGIETDDYATAKKELIKQLEANGLEDLEGDEMDDLLGFREAFETEPAPKKAAAKKTPAAEEEEEEEAPKKKATKKPAAKVEEEEEEETAAPAKKAASKEAEEEEEAPAKKKPAAKKDEEEEELVAEVTEKKPAKSPAKEKKAAPAKKEDSNSFSKDNTEHLTSVTKKLAAIFPAKEFAITPIVNGVTIRLLGDNAKVVILKISNVKLKEKGGFTGDLNFKKIKDVKALKDILAEEYHEDGKIEKVSGRNYVRLNAVSDKEILTIFDDDTLKAIVDQGRKIDSKMGANRAKMEETLKGSKADSKAPKKKAGAKAEEEEGDQFDKMDRDELKAFKVDNELEFKVMKSMSDDDIRAAIRAEYKPAKK